MISAHLIKHVNMSKRRVCDILFMWEKCSLHVDSCLVEQADQICWSPVSQVIFQVVLPNAIEIPNNILTYILLMTWTKI